MCTVIFFQTSRLRSKFSLIGKKKRRCTLKIISKFDILTKTLIAKNIGTLISRSIQLQIVASQLMHFVDYIRIEEIYIETNFSMKEI